MTTTTEPTPAGRTRRRRLIRDPWTWVVVGVFALAAILVRTLGASPGFDPYGWLTWGYHTIRGTLNINGAPSWKPVTWLFNVPYALTGHYAFWLWMTTAAAVALGGPIIAGRIAHRLISNAGGDRWAAWASALFAGLGVLFIVQYTHYWLSSQSDPMLVTFFLLAIDAHLNRRYWLAFTSLWLVSLGRPEGWPYFGLYFLWLAYTKTPDFRRRLGWLVLPPAWLVYLRWLWKTDQQARRYMTWVVVMILLVPLLWFGIPVIAGSYWDIAGRLAQHSPRQLHTNQTIGTIDRFRALTLAPFKIAAVIGIALAVWRRHRQILMVAVISGAWLGIEVAFSLHGFPGVPRYMFEGAATEVVVAGCALGLIVIEARRLPRIGLAGGIAAAVAFFAAAGPGVAQQIRYERNDLVHERARTTEIHRLDAALKAFGGSRFILSCGDPGTNVEYVSVLSWYTHMSVGLVGHQPAQIVAGKGKFGVPAVLFIPLFNGWEAETFHQTPAQSTRCASLNHEYYVVTSAHPGGEVLHLSH